MDGELREIFKDPKTDTGDKKSAKGLLCVQEVDGKFVLQEQCFWSDIALSSFERVFDDGKLVRESSLSEIRKRLEDKK